MHMIGLNAVKITQALLA